MDHQTLYAHILRDVLFISLIFDQKHIGDEEIAAIKTRWSELSDRTQTFAFKQMPHVIRELAINEIDHLEHLFNGVQTVHEFAQNRAELEKRTRAFLSNLQKHQLKRKAA